MVALVRLSANAIGTTAPRLNKSTALFSPSDLARHQFPRSFSPGRRCRTAWSSAAPGAAPVPPSRPSLFRRALKLVGIGTFCYFLGFAVTAAPAITTFRGLLSPPTDKQTLSMFEALTEAERQVEAYISSHALILAMRQKPGFTESRPHYKMPGAFLAHNLTGSTLRGPNRILTPPIVFADDEGKSLVSPMYLGMDLCGHRGIIHGGLLATILDEGMARCCMPALPHSFAVTANLNLDYRSPAPADNYFVLKATTTKVEGRKAWVKGRIETLVGPGETPVVVAEATGLFVSPKNAAMMPNVHATDNKRGAR